MNNEIEIWKDVAGYEGFYQVSNKGNVKSICIYQKINGVTYLVRREKLLTATDNGHGYMIVGLSMKGKRKNYYVHRLVADAFLPKQTGKSYVNHIDYNIQNNNVENLEWCTQKENVRYSAHKMRHQHNTKPKSGHKYIRFENGKYHFAIYNKAIRCYRGFDRLEEAIAYRNEVLNEVGYTV